jgi:hypothetical protein
MPDEIERIHKEVLSFERIEAVSDPMGADRGPVAGVGAQAAAEEAASLIMIDVPGRFLAPVQHSFRALQLRVQFLAPSRNA